VNLSHLGCWEPEPPDKLGKTESGQWAEKIVRITGEYSNVYADLADSPGLANHAEWGPALERSMQLWNELPHRASGNVMSKKLMYGSDWFVMAHSDLGRSEDDAMAADSIDWTKLRAGRSYAQRWASFSQSLDRKYGWKSSDFMGHNAIRFLGLDKARNRDRIDTFFCRNDIYWPEWRKKLDRLVKSGRV